MILACHNIEKSFGNHVIVHEGSFHIEEREKAAREFDSCIIKKLLTGRIKPVFFCQVFCFIT